MTKHDNRGFSSHFEPIGIFRDFKRTCRDGFASVPRELLTNALCRAARDKKAGERRTYTPRCYLPWANYLERSVTDKTFLAQPAIYCVQRILGPSHGLDLIEKCQICSYSRVTNTTAVWPLCNPGSVDTTVGDCKR
ncbi:hypothetical protein PoB_006230800 [Plakobranchus ocellatus]|uniref:Uncharacterized protein n=1 Tax=Plakobranchus ocellatus TaxID=259542 RepID=A0AAV4CV76_9GAST|nr:hypothetical protein PoB_006230800 [Plakobranchus ocellatus]